MTTKAPPLDPVDAKLLDLVQQEIPYESRPFATLAQRVGLSEEQALSRLRALRDERKIIRQISAIFDTKALGYQSSLVSGRYDPEKLDEAAAIISAHPGVSHNYKRNHAYNLWYTLAVPPDSRLGFDRTVELLHQLSGAQVTRPLPTLKLYKIGVKLNLAGEHDASDRAGNAKAFTEEDREIGKAFTLSALDIQLIRVLQQHMDITPQPWDAWAREVGCTVPELLDACRRFEERKQMRRFSAVLHHREAGFAANVMGVWKVPADQADQYGQRMAQFQAVSHCYLRPTYDDWPYNIYTMVHGQTRQDALKVLDAIEAETGITDHAALWSMKEYKKIRVEYFTPETAAWESRHVMKPTD
ncbi:MAG: AsnC family transcriptional regulator [Phycisphaeraceae bacterium]|nr:AsnC family transcriptional regulator [Phycisphaeraceae bacterium]